MKKNGIFKKVSVHIQAETNKDVKKEGQISLIC